MSEQKPQDANKGGIGQSASTGGLGVQLLPCPFCGSRMVRVKTRKTTIVECAACPGLVIRLNRNDAIAAWNRRTPNEKIQGDDKA